MRDLITNYSSMAEFLTDLTSNGYRHYASDGWAGGTWDQALAFARCGDVSHVPEAERILECIDSEIDSDGTRPCWQPSVVGAMPLVPAFVAGSTPECMIERQDVPDSRGELEVWVCTTVSGSCSAHDMVRRGVVSLALAMALARVRNVRMVLYSTCQSMSAAIRLNVPMDVSEVCAAFCQPSFTRQLLYGLAGKHNWDGKWAEWASVKSGEEEERKYLMENADMPADAIHLTTEKLGEYASVSDDELVEILNRKIAAYLPRAAVMRPRGAGACY